MHLGRFTVRRPNAALELAPGGYFRSRTCLWLKGKSNCDRRWSCAFGGLSNHLRDQYLHWRRGWWNREVSLGFRDGDYRYPRILGSFPSPGHRSTQHNASFSFSVQTDPAFTNHPDQFEEAGKPINISASVDCQAFKSNVAEYEGDFYHFCSGNSGLSSPRSGLGGRLRVRPMWFHLIDFSSSSESKHISKTAKDLSTGHRSSSTPKDTGFETAPRISKDMPRSPVPDKSAFLKRKISLDEEVSTKPRRSDRLKRARSQWSWSHDPTLGSLDSPGIHDTS